MARFIALALAEAEKLLMAKVIELLKSVYRRAKDRHEKSGSYVLGLVMTVKKLLHFKSRFCQLLTV